MTRWVRGSPTLGVRAMLTTRADLTLAFRLVVRGHQLLATNGGANSNGWRAVAGAFVVADVAIWLVLRGTDRYLFWPRLGWDALDIGIWSVAGYPGEVYDVAVLVGVPLAAEAGLRLDPKGLLIPLVDLTVIAVMRSALDREVVLTAVAWVAFGLVMGVAVALYDRVLEGRATTAALQRRAAECRRAELAGQNDVAMGIDSANDKLGQMRPLLGRPRPGTALWTVLDDYKAALRQRTDQVATYLGDVLLSWGREHNTHPDLSADVVPHVAPGVGTTILTGPQAADLRGTLETMDLRGPVPVDVADAGDHHLPGASLELVVDGRPVHVAPDRRSPSPPIEVGPWAFVVSISWLVRASGDDVDNVPDAVTALLIALFLGSAWFWHRRLRRVGRRGRFHLLAFTVALGMVQTALTALTRSQTVDVGGTQLFPAETSLLLLAILAGLFLNNADLDRRQRALLALGAGALILVGLAFLEPPYQPGDILMGVVGWPLVAYLPARRGSEQLRRATQELDKEWETGDAEAASEAFQLGRTELIGLMDAAVVEARQQLASVAPALEPEALSYGFERLKEVEECLRDLRAGESSSSTTPR